MHKAERIIIQERVNDVAQHPIAETAPFKMDFAFREREHQAYGDLAVACNLAHRACVLEDQALHVSNFLMMEKTPSIALTEFICNLEVCAFALMQSERLYQAEEYRLPKKGKTN